MKQSRNSSVFVKPKLKSSLNWQIYYDDFTLFWSISNASLVRPVASEMPAVDHDPFFGEWVG